MRKGITVFLCLAVMLMVFPFAETEGGYPTDLLSSEGVETVIELPAYSYTGDNPIEGAIVNTVLTDGHADLFRKEPGSVAIPCPIILKTVMNDETHAKVYGNFWILIYVKQGDILFNISGGENPAVVTLENTDGEWRVSAMEEAGDGDEYVADINRFADGDKELEEQYFASADLMSEQNQEIRTRFIREYVKANELDITAYQDYGWDPVALGEE